MPVSVQVGGDPSAATRYYYVNNAHGDVVDLGDTLGNLVVTYSYDSWGNLLSSNPTVTSGTNGWTNPYRYDASDGLSWLSVRAYDPTIGRFLSHDPLGRAPLFLSDNPYVYAGNNPITNVDPSGQRAMGASSSQVKHAAVKQVNKARMRTSRTPNGTILPCVPHTTVTPHWWGTTTFFGECDIQIMNNWVGFGAAAITAIGTACAVWANRCIAALAAVGVTIAESQVGAVVAFVVAVAIAILVGYVAWINNDDQACHNHGVFIDQAFSPPGATWIDSIC